MKTTPFHDLHRSLSAKLVEFAGYEMPIQYEGIMAEHLAVRKAAGVFDVSHMGEFWVEGPQAQAFVEYATTNDVASLEPGQVQYSVMCYDHGGIVDDLLVYRVEDRFLLVVNASNIEKDWEHLSGLAGEFDVSMRNASDQTALLAVQGPLSREIIQELTPEDLNTIPFYHFREGRVAGRSLIISRTGYTGELGFELYHDPTDAEHLWRELFRIGAERGLKPVGLGARDTLRMEMKFCLYGNDIDATTNPLEARLGWVVNLNGPDFHGRDALLKAKQAGLGRFLVAIRMLERGLPRHGYSIHAGAEQIGTVTSGGQSPSLGAGIAMGYVKKPHQSVGTQVEIDIRGRHLQAEVVRPPFLEKKTA